MQIFFEEYGIKVPTTLAELETACDTLVENGVTPFAAGAGANIMRYAEALLEYYCGAEEHDSLLSLRQTGANLKMLPKHLQIERVE